MFTANGIHLFSRAPEKRDNPGGKDMRAITCSVLAAAMWLNLQQQIRKQSLNSTQRTRMGRCFSLICCCEESIVALSVARRLSQHFLGRVVLKEGKSVLLGAPDAVRRVSVCC